MVAQYFLWFSLSHKIFACHENGIGGWYCEWISVNIFVPFFYIRQFVHSKSSDKHYIQCMCLQNGSNIFVVLQESICVNMYSMNHIVYISLFFFFLSSHFIFSFVIVRLSRCSALPARAYSKFLVFTVYKNCCNGGFF